MNKLSVHFTDTAKEEISLLVHDLRLAQVASIVTDKRELTDRDRQMLGELIVAVHDLFSPDVPQVEGSPEIILRNVSRDINLARVLRERGIFRLFLLLETLQDGLPIYMSIENPTTGATFATQEEFVGWFCREAKVSRSLIFMRLAAIGRLLSLGFNYEEAFNVIVSKPYAVRETLNMVAEWDKNELVGVNPGAISNITSRLLPEKLDVVRNLATQVQNGNTSAMRELTEEVKPVLRELMNEIADHESAKDALEWVKNDLTLHNDIQYYIDPDDSIIYVEMYKKAIDPQTGEVYELPPVVIPYIPDAPIVPQEIITDMQKRLILRTKHVNEKPF